MHAVLQEITLICLETYSIEYIVVVGMYVQHVKAIKVSGLTICVYSVFLTLQVVTFSFITCSLNLIMYQPVQLKLKFFN